jgi:hypothetical protein
MKKAFLLLLCIGLFIGACRLILLAQGTQQSSFTSNPGPLTGCPAPTVGKDSMCDVTGQGWMQSVDGAAYVRVGGGVLSAPVGSVFGRTGAIVSKAGDYSFAQLSGVASSSQLPASTIPAAFSCTGATFSNSLTSGGLSVSGCK